MIKSLTESDIGKTIWYIPSHAKTDLSQWEMGRIKSFDNERQLAWVVYSHGNNSKIDHYQEYTAAATSYQELSFNKVSLRGKQ
jgi:hypothetical protein